MSTRRRPAPAPPSAHPAPPARRSRGPNRGLVITPAGDAYLDAREAPVEGTKPRPRLPAPVDTATLTEAIDGAFAEVLPMFRAALRRRLAALPLPLVNCNDR